MSAFAYHETDEFLKDVVDTRDSRLRYHSALGGVPNLLASVHRQIEATDNEQDKVLLDSAHDLGTLFEAEWNLVKPSSDEPEKALAYLIAFGYPVTIDTIHKMSGISVHKLTSTFTSLPFLSFSTKVNGWEFTSDIFRRFVEDKLKRLVDNATHNIATRLLQDPDSYESLTHLPS